MVKDICMGHIKWYLHLWSQMSHRHSASGQQWSQRFTWCYWYSAISDYNIARLRALLCRPPAAPGSLWLEIIAQHGGGSSKDRRPLRRCAARAHWIVLLKSLGRNHRLNSFWSGTKLESRLSFDERLGPYVCFIFSFPYIWYNLNSDTASLNGIQGYDNTKTLSYQYGQFPVKEKTTYRPFFL